MAAIAAAQHGLNVALLEPGNHIGGMVSGGLSNSDVDRQEDLVGGLTRSSSRHWAGTTVNRSPGHSNPTLRSKPSTRCLDGSGSDLLADPGRQRREIRLTHPVFVNGNRRFILSKSFSRRRLRGRPDESGRRVLYRWPRRHRKV